MKATNHQAKRLDTLFDVLSHPCRRRILHRVYAHDPRETGGLAVMEVLDADEDLTAFRHVHAPKLEAAGYIDWDRAREEVSRGSQFAEVAPLLELLDENEAALPAEWP